MRYMVVTSKVEVIGQIWMPNATCAMDYNPRADDVRDEDGNITRDSVEFWLMLHSGDFQSITDFRADIADGETDLVFDWADPESEMTYNDGMFGDEF